VTESPAGSQWAVGTEIHLVNRLAHELPDRRVISLEDCGCLCSTMFRISPQHLCWTLESLLAGEVVNRVSVEPETKRWARVALDRMLDLK
jgi:quinolinate synthase